MSDPDRTRRVITATSAAGRSTILSDAAAPTVVSGPAFAAVQMWKVDRLPADLGAAVDAVDDGPVSMNPAPGGAVCWLCHVRPDSAWQTDDTGYGMEGFADHESGADPFHVTDAIDVVYVLSGEVYAVLEETETKLVAGDVLVQRGTRHAWSNRGDEVCVFAAVALSADPASRG